MRLLSDENFNEDIVRGLLLRRPDLDLRRVHEVGLEGADDPTILEWAAANNRIVLTHDRATMPDFAYARVVTGHRCPESLLSMIAHRSGRPSMKYYWLRLAANRRSGLA